MRFLPGHDVQMKQPSVAAFRAGEQPPPQYKAAALYCWRGFQDWGGEALYCGRGYMWRGKSHIFSVLCDLRRPSNKAEYQLPNFGTYQNFRCAFPGFTKYVQFLSKMECLV